MPAGDDSGQSWSRPPPGIAPNGLGGAINLGLYALANQDGSANQPPDGAAWSDPDATRYIAALGSENYGILSQLLRPTAPATLAPFTPTPDGQSALANLTGPQLADLLDASSKPAAPDQPANTAPVFPPPPPSVAAGAQQVAGIDPADSGAPADPSVQPPPPPSFAAGAQSVASIVQPELGALTNPVAGLELTHAWRRAASAPVQHQSPATPPVAAAPRQGAAALPPHHVTDGRQWVQTMYGGYWSNTPAEDAALNQAKAAQMQRFHALEDRDAYVWTPVLAPFAAVGGAALGAGEALDAGFTALARLGPAIAARAGPAVAGAGPAVRAGWRVLNGAADEVEGTGGTDEGAPTIGGRRPINSRLAGDVHPSGVRFNAQGFPDFGPYAERTFESDELTGGRSDVRMANRASGLGRTPKGYLWHHLEDGRTMQLIPKDIHRAVAHTGGRAVIRNGGFDPWP